jgi:hypothetical protein
MVGRVFKLPARADDVCRRVEYFICNLGAREGLVGVG